jgi:formiminotetrahydrofolate cyclodeaminase
VREQSLGDFLAALAGRSPVPGGGATAALHAAQAAALLEMTARYSRPAPDADSEQAVGRVIAEAGQLRESCAELIDIDGEAFGAVAEAYRLPRDTDAEQAARTAAVSAAMLTASAPPAELISISAALLELAEALAPVVRPSVAADLAAAAAAIRAAVVTSWINVEANLAAVTAPGARERLAAALAGASDLEQRAGALTEQIRKGLASAAPTG